MHNVLTQLFTTPVSADPAAMLFAIATVALWDAALASFRGGSFGRAAVGSVLVWSCYGLGLELGALCHWSMAGVVLLLLGAGVSNTITPAVKIWVRGTHVR
jgi:hypothetical protein